MTRFESIIFDLDGTLVNSLPGIQESAEFAVSRVLPDEPMPGLRELVGPPVAVMFNKLWPDLDPVRQASLLEEFRAHYDGEGCLHSEAYPGVLQTLAKLRDAGLKLFVLTNKPILPAKKILAHLGLAEFFTGVMGPDSPGQSFRSKPEGARLLLGSFQLLPSSTVLVGDGLDDMESAEACGMQFIAVDYGYGRVVERLKTTPLAVLKMISEMELILL